MSSKHKQQTLYKVLILSIVALVFFGLQKYLPSEAFKLSYLQAHLAELKITTNENIILSVILYIAGYILLTGISFPGATMFTILAGALFGFPLGFVAALIGSTLGATVTFILVKYLFQDFFAKKFSRKSAFINKQFERNGDNYLLTLRLVPIFPFFLVNLLMGLTPIKLRNYLGLTLIGMIPAIAVYTFAGLTFTKIHSIKSIVSWPMLLTFTMLGLLPYFSKFLIHLFKCYRLYSPFKKPDVFQYNLIVIGGGSAGLVSAYVANSIGGKIAIIEEAKMGGDCLNTGCVPSKTLIKAATLFKEQKHSAEFGLKDINAEVNFSDVIKNIHGTITKIEPHDSAARYRSLGIDCFQTKARLLSPWEVQIDGKVLSAKKIVIATGATPNTLNVPGIELINPLTSENLWDIKKLPHNLLIIGGGAIGIELAQAFNRFGSKVTVIENGSRILPNEEDDVSALVLNVLQLEGVTVYLQASVEKFDGHCAAVKTPAGMLDINFEQVLIAVGRKPHVNGFGIESLKIELNEKGAIKTNKYMQTNFPNIFACGDVAGPYQFTHSAAHQAKYVAINSLFGGVKKFKVDYRFIPRCTYTDPEVASVGKSTAELITEKIQFDVSLFDLKDLDRAIIEKETNGFVKVLTAKNSGKILGVTIVSKNASLMLQEFVLAMENNISLGKILNSVHPYPGFGEANKYVAGLWRKNSVSPKVLKWMRNWLRSGLE